ncbi:uncharacterized protein LOC111265278 [Varroa jacobsoni]|uniref:Uncharacterized protein n=1 Tax=Varroa destructor TaxID=109461 RepID=A0A7M7JYD1_VARDE|nr:uncharacterized protein LOC111249135 isoform X2 [Varroa destructor]XP_022697552.1 uncharacterized protein LOC111265278 [Varroa jacobsoni]XP_022697553.1 uncharacterized protein LOC111265278 [Varroa jacobsoni]XP_022697554.1 uncharacterized protein LOC111265278 [Varroa jacobsoni]XP_022697555.1 uncharacterized protein LOC111265278 [Varroa jacobsoni]XP_022697556.1 uncharacterized protein LOC111265278 [Varroa jacobsoni]XP_022697557.1 uncharacterized protein LOC111265278 [Varroa jacobsoni]XP_022
MERRAVLTPLSPLDVTPLYDGISNMLNLERMESHPSAVSPDEEVIRLRGRRSFEPHSPINIARYSSQNISPMKKVKSPAKVLQFRSPRKRLQMDLVDGVGGTPRGPSSPAKRFRVSLHGLDERASDPVAQLHSLNKGQLRGLLQRALSEEAVRAQLAPHMPAPDLTRMEAKLQQRLRAVQVAQGGAGRHHSQPSPPTFSKRLHPVLDEFRTKITSHVEGLLKGEQWTGGVEYVLLAWPYVRQLPEWREQVQNRTRLACFKLLAGLLATCLPRCSNLTDAHKETLARRISAMKPDCPQVVLPLVSALHADTTPAN